MQSEDVAGLFWIAICLWLIITKFDIQCIRRISAHEVPDEIYKQKEEIVFFFAAIWQVYGYICGQYASHIAEAEADRGVVHDSLCISVNILQKRMSGGHALFFPTLQEISPSSVFLDKVHLKRIDELAELTELDQPFLRMDCANNRIDREINKMVCNHLSSMCMEGQLAKCFGLPVEEHSCIFGLTNEKVGGSVACKLRLMLVREDTLKLIYEHWVQDESEQVPKFQRESHASRWDVLLKMAKMYFDETDADHSCIKDNRIDLTIKIDSAAFEIQARPLGEIAQLDTSVVQAVGASNTLLPPHMQKRSSGIGFRKMRGFRRCM